jgi:hypothetical protein
MICASVARLDRIERYNAPISSRAAPTRLSAEEAASYLILVDSQNRPPDARNRAVGCEHLRLVSLGR